MRANPLACALLLVTLGTARCLAADAATAPAATQPATQPSPEAHVLASIDEGIALLEAGRHADFMQRFLAPAEKARLLEKQTFEALVENFKSGKSARLLATLRAARHETPRMVGGGGEARFRPEGQRPIAFIKVDGVWYILNE